LTVTILDLVQQATNYKQLRKGANEGKVKIWSLQGQSLNNWTWIAQTKYNNNTQDAYYTCTES
jgi:hypothetical protein